MTALIIHGHFYQPPRENPWLEAVEIQDSAYPYHDWNERVTAECYAPNSASRIIDGERRIREIISNYAKISFNFGPTLMMWMEAFSPELYQSILEADRQSLKWRAGHGAAIAQVYHHLIMPLAAPRDKRSQVIWGIKDFEHRFQRFPEGMWLAETAVDLETLDILAEQGIKFTILAPHQAAAVRTDTGEWTELGDGQIDPSRGYFCKLPSQRTIAIFFYDGAISKAVAFENQLENGERFAQRLMEGFSESRDWPQLMHIATDGETYGHHHRYGDMALAAVLDYIEANNLARLTNYGEYLEHHPPSQEVQIRESSSWSCPHGVERWKSNCGCNSGGHPGWNQEWRAPLRDALDWLREQLTAGYEQKGREYLKDPWHARDAYIQVILDRSEENVNRFLGEHAARELNEHEKIIVFKLLEIQRHAMLMYTSCGWFFDELSGLETVQIIKYAGRTLQLAEGLLENGLEKGFLEKIGAAKSNIPEHNNGARIYEKFVKPAQVDLTRVGIHFAFSSLYKEYEEQARIFCYTVATEDYEKLEAEEASLALGKISVTSGITRENKRLIFCVVRFGRHDFKGSVCCETDEAACTYTKEELKTTFEKGYFTEIIGLMDKHFGMHSFSLADLFKDEQRTVLNLIIDTTREEFEEKYHSMYEPNRSLMEFVQETGMPVPRAFIAAAEVSLNSDIKNALTEEEVDADKFRKIIASTERWGVATITPDIEIFIRRHLEGLMTSFSLNPSDFNLLTRIRKLMELLRSIPVEIVLWQIQNIYYNLAKTTYREFLARTQGGDQEAAGWVEEFGQLGQILTMNLTAVLAEG